MQIIKKIITKIKKIIKFKKAKTHLGKRRIYSGIKGEDVIINELLADKPSLICRYGSLEISVVDHYIRYFIDNKENPIAYPEQMKQDISNIAGFFPAQDDMLSNFALKLIEVTKNIDVIGVWFKPGEEEALERWGKQAELVRLENIDPLMGKKPWTKHLRDKKVLVIHPFEATIQSQYKKREFLFKNKDILPEFDLITLKPVQSVADEKEFLPYKDWFEALEHMKSQIKEIDFDIALIGAGAYGIFLADYCKSLGKKAVHVGGCLQLLFGIRGKRWEERKDYKKLMNEHWTRPNKDEIPKGVEKVEGGCYW